MIAVLALTLLAADPAVKARAAHSSAPATAFKPDPCERLDAASYPACATRTPRADPLPPPTGPLPKAANTPPMTNSPATPAINAPAPARPTAPVAKARPPAKATAPAKPPGPLDKAAALLREQPILVGGASGLAVLLVVGVSVIGISRATRGGREADPAPPGGSPPTRWRRDLVLSDQDGRDWRIDGAHLTPSATLGSDAACDLRRGDAGIAPRHVEFWVRDGRLMLRRLADPVFVNDRLLKDITPEAVSTGDQLRVGSTTFTITID